METATSSAQKSGGLVWILSGLSLTTYALLLLSNQPVPGVEQLVDWLSDIESQYIYLTALVVMFIEGLYFIGSFFPGSSTVVVLAILSGTTSPLTFLITITLNFIGWSLSSVVNIFLAYRAQKLRHQNINEDFAVKDNIFTTWFPAFRANYEVAQVAEGGNPWKVLVSSVKVKFLVSLFMLLATYIASFLIDLQSLDNEEGASGLFVIAAICFVVGWRKYKS